MSGQTIFDRGIFHEATTDLPPTKSENETGTETPLPGSGQAEVAHVQIMSDEQRKIASDVLATLHDVILPFAMVVTVINVIVFMHKSMRTSTSYYVVGVSLAQLVYLGLDVGGEILRAIIGDGNTAEWYGFYFYYIYLFNPGISIFRRGPYIVMCLVSLERIYAIVRPLHIKEFILARRPVLFIVSTYIVTAAFHFYSYCRLDIVSTTLSNGVTVYFLEFKDFYLRHTSVITGFDINAHVMFVYLPLLALMSLNLVTLVFLKRRTIERYKMQINTNSEEEAKKQRQLTVTILGATVCYVVLSVPLALHSLVYAVVPFYFSRSGLENNLYIFLMDFSYLGVMISCFTDFVSFLLLSSAYRRTFVTIFHLNKLFGKREKSPGGGERAAISGSTTNDTLVTGG